MMEFLSDPVLWMLIGAAFLAGLIDSIAGGGGLITIPALFLSGLPPLTALGTNKLQSLFGSLSDTIAYARTGHVHLKSQWLKTLLALTGGIAGASLATILPTNILKAILPFLLITIALYFAFKPSLDNQDRARRISTTLFTFTIPPLLGFYDGVFGPGTGSFLMLAFVSLAGYGLLKATAHTKLLNFSSNLGSFAIFTLAGAMHWKLGIIMGIAQFTGAQTGARLASKNGAKLIKPLLIIVCCALAASLLFKPDNQLRELLHF